MNTQKGTMAAVLLGGGAALIIIGLAFSFPQLQLYVETMAYTDRIPTAPPLETTPTLTTTPTTLMPFQTKGDDPIGSDGEAIDTADELEEATEDSDAADEADAAAPAATPAPTPTPVWEGVAPLNLVIPAIQLDAPVTPIGLKTVNVGGKAQAMWNVPDGRVAGWHNTSAKLGVVGNTVLNGHNTTQGEVFRDLYKLQEGDAIQIGGEDGQIFDYVVGEKYILPEAGQPLSVRLENARYIQATPDERLTLVTCHPYGSLRNRLIIIAYPTEGTALEAWEEVN